MATVEHDVPPLVPGERLTREEFLRRWEAMPEVKFAELLGGVVYLPSPLRRPHGHRDNKVSTWLGTYEAYTPGCEACQNTTWLMPDEEAPQPDGDLRILPEYGGQSRNDGEYGAGAPELLAETWSSRRSTNVALKLRIYRDAGVLEYVAVFLKERTVEWRSRSGDAFDPLTPGADGILRSRVFPGLWLDPAALLAGDMARVLTVLNQGLATPEHAEFVARLAARRAAGPSS